LGAEKWPYRHLSFVNMIDAKIKIRNRYKISQLYHNSTIGCETSQI